MDWSATTRVETQVEATAARRPHQMALIYGRRCWTYAQLRVEYDRRAAMLVDAGVRPGDIVATTEPPTDSLYLTFLAPSHRRARRLGRMGRIPRPSRRLVRPQHYLVAGIFALAFPAGILTPLVQQHRPE